MANVKAFQALRFTSKAGEIESLCCPPYDIISESERLAYLAKNPHNIIRLELPHDGEDVYQTAGETLQQFLADGIVKQDDTPAFYIYGESFAVDGVDYWFKGIIGRVQIEPFDKGVVLPHEETLSKAKRDRFELMNHTMCNFSQIYSLYQDENGVTNALVEQASAGKPVAEFTQDGVTHRLWVVTDADTVAAISSQFAHRKLYIADGHHRYETALNFRDHLRETGKAKPGDACDDVMMMLVPMDHPGLVVLPTHRVIHHMPSLDVSYVVEKAGDCFAIERVDNDEVTDRLKEKYDQGHKSFVLYADGKSLLFTLTDTALLDTLCEGKSDALKGLDVTVLHTLVLERILGIDKENMAKQLNLSYTRDLGEAIELVDRGEANAAFLMNPTKVSEIGDVAAAGEKMPQKSTYFYPKLITGLVMNQFEGL